jgi:hypothetical protein
MPIEELLAQVTTRWRFDYETKVKALRDLYEVAKKEQWNAAADIPWDLEIDPRGDILARRQDPSAELDVVRALPEEKRTELAIHNAAWILSQFLHGEQGALLCCGQLVEAVPDIDGKLYSATQVVDEARHVSYGLIYMRDELPSMPDPERERVEDFAYAAVELLSGRKPGTGLGSQMELWRDVGIDPAQAVAEILEKVRDPKFRAAQPDAFRDYVMPQLVRLGIITDRTAPKYRALGFELPA